MKYEIQVDMSSHVLVILIVLSSNFFCLYQCSAITKYFKEGSTAVIRCPYKSSSFPLLWMKGEQLKLLSSNNLIVSNDHQHKLETIGNYSDGEYNLVIKNFSTNDQGLYRCQGIVKETAFAADIMTVLAIPPSNIKIANKTKLNTIELFEGRNHELTCSVSNGIPSVQIVLNIDGKDVKNGSNDFISFHLMATKTLHRKPITCTANQSFLEKPLEDGAILFVFNSPNTSIAVKPLADILEGNRIILECFDSSNMPSKNYSWKRDGLLLTATTRSVLEIYDVTKKDSGIYECHVQNKIGSSGSSIRVNVYHRPYLLGNSTSTLNYKTEVGGRVLVSIPIESNPKPLTVSCLNITDLKLDDWIIEQYDYGKHVFLLSTTLFPIHTEQYGVYVILVRNKFGSLKLDINLQLPDANVTILPAYPLCDVAENLTLSCTLHQENFRQWTNYWSHWINKIFIRNVSGIIKGNTSFIYFPFCDYQDFGTYECNWVLQNRHGITSVFVLVNAKPVKTDYRITISNTDILLSVDIFSRELIRSIDWYENGFRISNKSEIYKSYLRTTDIQLSVYKKHLKISGFEVGLKIRHTNFSEQAIYICQITNVYGSTDMYFEADQFLQNTKEYTESTTLVELSTRVDESTNGLFYHKLYQNIHFIISGFVFMCAIIIAIICWIKKGRRKFTLRKQNESNNTEQEQNDQDGIDESDYAEIENEYYQSVEWRVYPSGICISPLRSGCDHSSTSPKYQNAILHQNDDYLEVITDAESLKDEHTAIICDNASALGVSSSSKSSDRSTSSYIQTIIKYSSSETEDLSLGNDVEKSNYNSFSKSTNSEPDFEGPSHSTYCLNIQAALRLDEDEFESNISDDNTELCELKPIKESVTESSKYEQLNISQTETHLYNQ